MAAAETILAELSQIANNYWGVAVAWHGVLAVVLGLLATGSWRPTRRAAACLLALPAASVAAAAWLHVSLFNALMFTLLAAWMVGAGVALPKHPVRPARGWPFYFGIAVLAYAWVYPHFLTARPTWVYLVAAPVGLLPCPTLAALLGLGLMGGGFSTRTWSLALAAVGLFYGMFGVAVLGVALDLGLCAAALGMAFVAFTGWSRLTSGAEREDASHAERLKIDEFLSCRRIALIGASTDVHHFSRAVMRALLDRGIDVVPVNPRADTIAGRRAYAGLELVSPPVEAALVMTPPDVTASVVEQCAAAHVQRVWLHAGAGRGTVSEEALRAADEHGLSVVAGRCPLMFVGAHPQLVHRVHAGALKVLGRYPA